MSEVYLDTFEAAHDPLAAKVAGGGRKVHYLIKRTGRSDFPYLLYGPFVGEASNSPWPSKRDVETFFEQHEQQLASEGGPMDGPRLSGEGLGSAAPERAS